MPRRGYRLSLLRIRPRQSNGIQTSPPVTSTSVTHRLVRESLREDGRVLPPAARVLCYAFLPNIVRLRKMSTDRERAQVQECRSGAILARLAYGRGMSSRIGPRLEAER